MGVGVLAAGAAPNGFVLFGLAPPAPFKLLVLVGIRFSRLTSDAFSPRKLSGVLRVKAAAAAADDDLAPPVAEAALLMSELLVACGMPLLSGAEKSFLAPAEAESQGFVLGFEVVAEPLPPKKSPNGSSFKPLPFVLLLFVFVLLLLFTLLFDKFGAGTGGGDIVILLFENKSKSSNLPAGLTAAAAAAGPPV